MAERIEIGSVVRGKYRIERVLGEGGMGTVLAAWHELLGQRVAIKVLLPDLVQNPALLARFQREAQAASRIRSDHVARVIDVDALEGGVPFMVMEYLEGHDLSALMPAPLPHPVAVEYVLQACDAIAEAHARGIVHRDLKPANLFLTRTREGKPLVKVLDFGISKIEKAEGGRPASVTKTSAVMGSAVYMSPEQMLSSRDVDGRTDIWSLGVTLYELCTGEVPFPGETLPQVCALVMNRPPPPPRSLRPELPEELEAVILRCLDKDRERRYPTIAELCAALAPHAGERDPTVAAKLAHALTRPPERIDDELPARPLSLPRGFADQATTVPADSALPEIAQAASGATTVREAAPTQVAGPSAPAPRPAPAKKAALVALVAALAAAGLWLGGRTGAPTSSASPIASTASPALSAPTPPGPASAPPPAVTPDAPAPTLTASASAAPPATSSAPAEPSAAPRASAKKPVVAKPPPGRPSNPGGPSIY